MRTDDVQKRLTRHNSGETRSIKHGIPWKLLGYLVLETRSEAMNIEKGVKKRGIKRWLEQNQSLLIQTR